jgi:IPT/TIG domain
VVVLLGLIPLAYGAFVMFRVPVPKITTIAPAQVAEHQEAVLTITGKDLRPFLDVRFGTIGSKGFFVQSPTHAEVKLPDLPAGTYDLTLLDEGQVLTVKPGALTVGTPAVKLDVQAVGAFVGLNKDDAGLIGVKSTFQPPGAAAPIAEVLAVRAMEPRTSQVKIGANVFATGTAPDLRMPAILRLHCTVLNGECRVADTVAAQNATITLLQVAPPSRDHTAPPAAGQVKFLIGQLFPAGMAAAFPEIASVRVRFVAEPTILNVIKTGDADVSGVVSDTDRAVLTEMGTDRQTVTSSVRMEGLLRIELTFPQPLMAFTGTVRVPVVFTPAGWSYKDKLLKVGGAFTFESAAGAMSGLVLEMNLGQEKSRAAQ